MLNMNNEEPLSIVTDEEFEKAYAQIKERFLTGKTPEESPIGVILGGQPGAGKETIYGIFNEKCSNNIVRVNCDDFRPYHPHYFELNAKYGANDKLYNDEFVGRISRKLLSELSDKHYSFIFESTLRTPNVALNINKDIQPKGYKTILCIMATPKEVSWQGTLDRKAAMIAAGITPRAVAKDFHDLVVSKICDSLDTVYKSGKMSNILIYNRQKECLYDMNKTPELNPKGILDSVLNGRSKEIAKAETKPSLFSRSAQKSFSSKAAEINSNRPTPNIQKNNDIEK